MTDLSVCPQALRMQAREIGDCSVHYTTSAARVGEHRLSPLALGALGRDIVQHFNDMSLNVSNKLKDSAATVQSAADGIHACATHFEGMDDDYYRKFGYINETLGY
ncbi:hypothetical protein [Nocardia sp. NPDC058666]|uniref:hypothetical protein n=1 Tax=unclassified Nocardia TaxID=2637762 RepID=UPI00365B22BF